MLRNTILAAVLLTAPVFALAQEEEDTGPWSGAASLGYLSTAGNTETTSFNTKFDVGYETGNWLHTFGASALGSDQEGVTLAEAYQALLKTAYSFTEHDYVFGLVDWRKDRFSGVEQQVSEAIGYGRRLIDTPVHLLSAEVGIGHRSADLVDGTSESGVIGRAGLDYTWTFSETSNFNQLITIETGSDNTYTESVSALRARVLGDFAVVLSYTIRNNSDVPLGTEKSDRLTAVSIEYAF